MRKIFITLPFVLAVAATPAFAGNGTDSSAVRASQGTVIAQVDTRASSASQIKPSLPVSPAQAPSRQKTRAEVHAEAVAWTKSGMGDMVYGEVPFDSRGPSFDRAVQSYQQLREEQAARAGK